MALKRHIEGKGWVTIAGSPTSSNSKAINVSVSDTLNLFDTNNVEGALAELGYKIKNISTTVNKIVADFNEYKTNHSRGSSDESGESNILPTTTSDNVILVSPNGKRFELIVNNDGSLSTKEI